MNHPWIYLNNHGLYGSNGKHAPLHSEGPLPSAGLVVQAAGELLEGNGPVGLLLEDAMMHPLRLSLEEPAPARDLTRFLTWKLKRFLPFSADQAEVRQAPLSEPDTYLTLSLPKAWVTRVYEGLAELGFQCGYISGAFASLLDNLTQCQGRRSLAVFDEFYIYAHVDGKGRWLDFRTRRLPLDQSGALDAGLLAGSDWEPLLQGMDGDALLFNFAHDDIAAQASRALQARNLGVQLMGQTGLGPAQRFAEILAGKGGAA